MLALAIAESGFTYPVNLTVTQPEADVHSIIGGPIYVVALTHFAPHLDMWTLVHQMTNTADSVLQVNTVATGLAASVTPADSANDVYGTAVITARTEFGLVAALAPSDACILARIAARILDTATVSGSEPPSAVVHHCATTDPDYLATKGTRKQLSPVRV